MSTQEAIVATLAIGLLGGSLAVFVGTVGAAIRGRARRRAQHLLDSVEFYNAMQEYRYASPTDQREVSLAFERVKKLIREV